MAPKKDILQDDYYANISQELPSKKEESSQKKPKIKLKSKPKIVEKSESSVVKKEENISEKPKDSQ